MLANWFLFKDTFIFSQRSLLVLFCSPLDLAKCFRILLCSIRPFSLSLLTPKGLPKQTMEEGMRMIKEVGTKSTLIECKKTIGEWYFPLGSSPWTQDFHTFMPNFCFMFPFLLSAYLATLHKKICTKTFYQMWPWRKINLKEYIQDHNSKIGTLWSFGL